ncbi:MAG: hypothetical protein A4E68_01910 [Syntrophaceae bacterium PtaB.Bin095]|jgi:hypothetical protein|nr:MAG: hypothetical protein A4E68_01910 [Syntrophaceae bacterium PtaB.Bin095]
MKKNEIIPRLRYLRTFRIGNFALSGRYFLDAVLWDAGWTIRVFGWGGHLLLYRKNRRKKEGKS